MSTPEKPMYPLDEYRKRLAAADWHYDYAEGRRYYEGREEVLNLLAISMQSPEHKAMFELAKPDSMKKNNP